MMSWIEVGGILAALILITAVALTVWKKNLHKCAKEGEIKVLALCLSAALTCSAGVGFGFPGIPWALVSYTLAVFFLQWLVSQKVLDWLWKLGRVLIEARVKRLGGESDD